MGNIFEAKQKKKRKKKEIDCVYVHIWTKMLKNNRWLLWITHEKPRFYYVFTTAPMLRSKKYEPKFSKCPIIECSTKLHND